MNERMKNFYMDIAEKCANMSRAIRLKVGAVIVKDNNIISFSWNGTPIGWDNICEDKIYLDPVEASQLNIEAIEKKWPLIEEKIDGKGNSHRVRYNLKTKAEVLHAESNCISKLAKSNDSGLGADLFVTHGPCMECAKLIYQSGIKRVFYGENYRDDAGIQFLKRSDIHVEQIIKEDKNV